MRRTIRLKESELKRMIAESVRRVLNEDNTNEYNEAIKCVKCLMDYAINTNNDTLQELILKVMEELSISWEWFNRI